MKKGPKPKPLDKPVGFLPECPKGLDPKAKRHWHETVDLVASSGCLLPVDRDALELYCILYARFKEAEEIVKNEGAVIVAANGYRQKNPWLVIGNDAIKDLKNLSNMLGMNPRSRSTLKLKDEDEVDPKWDGLL